jgi:hypothetical protein
MRFMTGQPENPEMRLVFDYNRLEDRWRNDTSVRAQVRSAAVM